MAADGPYAAANRFRWSTKVFDPETGSPGRISPSAELSDFGKRYYSATLGRWISRDPIGELGGVNVYAYVGNNPANRTDYLGLMWLPCPAGHPCGPDWPPIDDDWPEDEDEKPCPKQLESQPTTASAPAPVKRGPYTNNPLEPVRYWHGNWKAYQECFTAAYDEIYGPCKAEVQFGHFACLALSNAAFNDCVAAANRKYAWCLGLCAKLPIATLIWACNRACDVDWGFDFAFCRTMQGGLIIGCDLQYLMDLDFCDHEAVQHARMVCGDFMNQ